MPVLPLLNSNYIFCIDHHYFNMDGQNDPLTSFFADEPLFQQAYTIPQQPQSMAAAMYGVIFGRTSTC